MAERTLGTPPNTEKGSNSTPFILRFNQAYRQACDALGARAVFSPFLVNSRDMLRAYMQAAYPGVLSFIRGRRQQTEAQIADGYTEHLAADQTNQLRANGLPGNQRGELQTLFKEGLGMPIYPVDPRLAETNPQQLFSLISDARVQERLGASHGLLQIAGGAGGFEDIKPQTAAELLNLLTIDFSDQTGPLNAYQVAKILYDMASEYHLAIMTGGTQQGIMEAIGAMHLYRNTQRAVDGADLLTAGLTPLAKPQLIQSLELPFVVSVFPERTVILPENMVTNPRDGRRYAIVPGSVGFMVMGETFGGETPTLDAAAAKMGYVPAMEGIAAELQTRTAVAYGKNRIVAVINGGEITLNEVLAALKGINGDIRSQVKFLIMEGTGRSADWIAELLSKENGFTTAEQLFEAHPDDKDLQKESYRAKLNEVATRMRELQTRGLEARIEVVDIRETTGRDQLVGTIRRMLL